MSDNENKKSNEALADEALDKVAGGETTYPRFGYCLDCNANYPLSQAIQNGGKYYCPYHFKRVLVL